MPLALPESDRVPGPLLHCVSFNYNGQLVLASAEIFLLVWSADDGHLVCIIVLSHWPHVAQQVQQQIAELVAELVFAMYFNRTVHTSNKLSILLLNLCPRMLLEPFTLDTC